MILLSEWTEDVILSFFYLIQPLSTVISAHISFPVLISSIVSRNLVRVHLKKQVLLNPIYTLFPERIEKIKRMNLQII